MAKIEIEVGGRRYPLTCRDDEEPQLRRAAALLDRRCREASAALGTMSEPKQLLLGALLVADELLERDGPGAGVALAQSSEDRLSSRIAALTRRVESLCAVLEMPPPNA
jgi:cell division protein ZapA